MLLIANFRVLYENTFYHSRWLNIFYLTLILWFLFKKQNFAFFTILQVTQTEAIRSFIDGHFARAESKA